ncbi:hypothetical protein KBK19_15520 [Microvirga sp. STR05]|uniref:Uncharacterized protein n=1 Tax=Hymenobacter duratus TaxID=2771356 RepID=A0ABR8JKR6_9BACT|nr:hypothetical protein [Hymenobacter duratus]MBD2716450.1 hypothetical protein [Hymenobacter duratus]MBR7951365.1 hypothetical protein [Microvirga sp. STR05]
MADKTPDDRRHDIKLLKYGFLLTTLVGGVLTLLFQLIQNQQNHKAAEKAENVKIMEQRRAQATSLFEEFSPLMDTRLYHWRQVAWAIEDRISEDSIRKRYAAYQHVFHKWNFSLNKNRALICRFFGPEIGSRFESQIIPQFNGIQDTIRKIIKMQPSQRPIYQSDEINSLADALNTQIYKMNNEMAEAIRSGDIGPTNPGEACDFND